MLSPTRRIFLNQYLFASLPPSLSLSPQTTKSKIRVSRVPKQKDRMRPKFIKSFMDPEGRAVINHVYKKKRLTQAPTIFSSSTGSDSFYV